MSAPLLPGERPSRVPTRVRWLIACAVVVLALAVAIWPRGSEAPAPAALGTQVAAASPSELEAARVRAALPPCPAGIGVDALRGLAVTCLADGAPLDLAASTGRPMLVNIWAYWCGPCRQELPILAEVAARAAERVSVLTVHADPNAAAGLDLLAELNVRLATVEDPQARVATLLGAPRAYPVTVLLRGDGTVAGVHALPFTSAQQVIDVLRSDLGVSL